MSDNIEDQRRYKQRQVIKKRWRDKSKLYIKAYYYWYYHTIIKPGSKEVNRPDIKDFK